MKTQDALEQRLRQLGAAVAPSHSLSERVVRRIEREGIRPIRSSYSPWMGVFRLSPAVAVCAVLFALLYFLAFSDSDNLSHRVWAATIRAQTIHAIGKRPDEDGTLAKGVELWYEQGKGSVWREFRKGKERVWIDDGKHRWEYTVGAPTARRSDSIDPLGPFKELLNVEALTEDFVPLPEEDRTMDGVPSRCFIQDSAEMPARQMAWIGEDNLVRRWEERWKEPDGTFRDDEVVEVSYGEPIDPSVFEPDFGPGVRIIDEEESEAAFDKWLSAKQILYSTETLGLNLAVHELQSFEGGGLYVVCSLGPTEETLQKFGPGIEMRSDERVSYRPHGRFSLTSWWKRLPNGEFIEHSYRIHQLMSLSHHGVEAQWYLLVRHGEWPEQDKEFELCGYFHTSGPLEESLNAEGVKTWMQVRPIQTLPLPTEVLRIEDIIQMAWEDTQSAGSSRQDFYMTVDYRRHTPEEIQESIDRGVPREEAARYLSPIREKVADLSEDKFAEIFKSVVERLAKGEMVPNN